MGDIVQLLGPYHSVQMLGVRLVGFNAQNGKKLLFSVVFLLLVWFLGRLLKWIAGKTGRHENARSVFWSRQAVSITVTLVGVIGLLSIWFDDPSRLAIAIGLVTAGLAFALQREVTVFAGYIVILTRTSRNQKSATRGERKPEKVGARELRLRPMAVPGSPDHLADDPNLDPVGAVEVLLSIESLG